MKQTTIDWADIVLLVFVLGIIVIAAYGLARALCAGWVG